NSDVRLVEIDEAIPPLYRVYYAGWNALNQTQTSATGIHHPRGDIKKISFSTSGTTTADYLGSSGSGTSHWRIVWTDGTTEGGSSGSPLFDPNRRIVGQLHGGWASCTQMSQPDYYGKFSQSMDFGTSSANRLREWLDPDATGTDLLDGRDGYDLEAAVLLIDRTGSMSLLTADGRTRFEVAIEYARQDAEEIYENHPGVSVLVGHFETDNVIVAGQPWRTDLTNVLADITAVEALGTGNMTPLADAISEAADVLAGASTPGFGNLYIYTDGNENYSEIGSSEYTVTGPCYSDLINFPDDPADVIAGTGTGIDWDYGCDPGDPGSNCGDYQECVADELIAEGIIYARYFGLPILKSGTDPEDESRTPMDALATDASGLDGGTGRDSEGLKFFRYLAEASGGEFQFVSDVNQPPIASCQDVTVYADADCLAWASIDNGSYDPDGDPIMIVQVPTGPYPLGQTLVTLTVSDNFLLSSSCQATVTVVDTTSPVCIPPDDATIFLCTPTEICLPVACTDNCDPNSTITVVGGPGEIVGNQSWCYTPPGNGTYDVTMRCTDSSGNSCDAEFSVTIWMAQLAIEKTHNTFQGQFVDVSITIVGLNLPMGGFDVLVAYDASALGLQSATPGPPFYDPAPDGCGWEYFTYRFGPFGNCGDACPSGMVRIFGLAETNNGPNHPSCYGVPDSDPHELATMTFLVTNDRTFECQYVPIWFFWGDCGDNTISSQDGGVLYLDRLIHDYDGRLIWDEDDDDQFPEDERIPYVGAPDYCLNPDPNKPSPFRLTCFVNGGVDIVCADSIDARGDINLNGVPNEVADAVLFGRWFVIGGGCWPIGPPVEAYIAATDVNADGITLSVADFVYLVRIITGDALPYPKLSPVTADADLVNGVLSVNTDMGAAYVVVENSITPRLLAESMEMKYQYDVDNNLTRILVFSLEKDRRFSGDFLGGVEGNVMILEMATYDGTPVTTKLVPDEFALYPSYPNPFNPVATISFALAQPVDYELVIYNSLGQMVKTFSGHSGPGFERLDWNASGFASGVYFYRLTAGDFTDTRKMVLLK
ncbi:MAG: T9SS type A sorting domain-containing protein, partial [candidate division Zixibacteria bacterium]|nr:T9SS type A sorting domain-containing protein [candidate division Zixibacteria bacterium]